MKASILFLLLVFASIGHAGFDIKTSNITVKAETLDHVPLAGVIGFGLLYERNPLTNNLNSQRKHSLEISLNKDGMAEIPERKMIALFSFSEPLVVIALNRIVIPEADLNTSNLGCTVGRLDHFVDGVKNLNSGLYNAAVLVGKNEIESAKSVVIQVPLTYSELVSKVKSRINELSSDDQKFNTKFYSELCLK